MINDRIIKEAFELSQRSSVDRAKLGAFLFSGKKLISKACNASFYGDANRWTIHAEEFAILKANRLKAFSRFDDFSIAVFRFNNFGERRSSKPCETCRELLSKYNIKRMFFFDEKGNIIEERV